MKLFYNGLAIAVRNFENGYIEICWDAGCFFVYTLAPAENFYGNDGWSFDVVQGFTMKTNPGCNGEKSNEEQEINRPHKSTAFLLYYNMNKRFCTEN